MGPGKVEWFPNYLQLPALLVREAILKNLTDPQDKLNLLKVIPSEGSLMRWDLTTLQFQVVFPILMEREALDWKEIYLLSRVNDSFRDWIHRYFEDQHLADPKRRNILIPDCLIDFAVRFGDPEGKEWSSGFNPTSQLLIRCMDGHDESRENEFCKILEVFGHRFLICTIFLRDRRPAPEQLQSVSRYLTRMPNLISLVVSLRVWYGEEDHEWEPVPGLLTLEDVQLPELPSLKRIVLFGTRGNRFALARQRLLEKYAPGLLQLEVHEAYPKVEENFRIQSPNLYQLEVKDISENLDLFFRYVNMFLASPLRKIKLEVVEPNGRSRFSSLMIFLSCHFGGTLEELTIYLGIGTSDRRYSKILDSEVVTSTSLPSPPATWMLDCKFPKVKSLSLDCFPCLEGMAFLLLFPALEKLTFAKIGKPQKIIVEDEILDVSLSSQEQMIRAGSRKLLPRLDVMSFKGYPSCCDVRKREEWQVTQKEMVRYQAGN